MSRTARGFPQAVFAAQFARSHACWPVTYPLPDWLVAAFGPVTALIALAALASLGILLARRLWPAADPQVLEHRHDDRPFDHPQLRDARTHANVCVIEVEHPL